MALDPSHVLDSEALAHFIFESSKIRGDGTVHHRALMPSIKTGNKSVFRINNLTDAEISGTGQAEVGDPQARVMLGWARLLAARVREQKLTVRTDEPPLRHALIEGWSTSVEEQRLAAMALAQNAQFVRRP
jgi:hypothetical protein